MDYKNVVTRFPPSPTGRFHVGSARTTLFNYLFAKKHDGKFVFRFEDTDQARSKREYEQDFIESLAWLGLTDYEPPFRQSERTDVYQSYLNKMIEEGHAYISKEDPKEAGQRSEVIRFKNPNIEVTFTDLIRGEITVDTTDLGDFVIARSIDDPLYHLTVVIDDYEANVSHVIRGEEHISNTPRQILIQRAIKADQPIYAHIPMVLGSDKAKLSKRHGAKSVLEYRDDGYLPAALVNYLALLGWHPSEGDEQEIFTFNELVDKFELEKVQKSGAVFSDEKLRWVNKQHLVKLSDSVIFENVLDWLPDEVKNLTQYSNDRLARFIDELKDRIEVFSDVRDMAMEGEFDYLFETPGYFATDLIWKKSNHEETVAHLNHLQKLLDESDDSSWSNPEDIKNVIWSYAELKGKGDILWPLRYCLSGAERSPDPITLLYVLQKNESISRIELALNKLNNADS